MENEERMGTVHMKPFEALKKGCEENSINRVISVVLPKFEKILDSKNLERKQEKEQIPMFTQDTQDKYIGQDLLEELKEDYER